MPRAVVLLSESLAGRARASVSGPEESCPDGPARELCTIRLVSIGLHDGSSRHIGCTRHPDFQAIANDDTSAFFDPRLHVVALNNYRLLDGLIE